MKTLREKAIAQARGNLPDQQKKPTMQWPKPESLNSQRPRMVVKQPSRFQREWRAFARAITRRRSETPGSIPNIDLGPSLFRRVTAQGAF